jgi:hypothetical protein
MSANESKLLEKLKQNPDTVGFQEVMSVIADNYAYSPSAFTNGHGETMVTNEAGSNEGSCKIFAFAKLHQLSESETLHCFGDYYRADVLENPSASDHGNIRAFMESGWEGIRFDVEPLRKTGRTD